MRLSLKLGKVMNRNGNGEWERRVEAGNRNGKWKQGMERGRETASGNGEWGQAMVTGNRNGDGEWERKMGTGNGSVPFLAPHSPFLVRHFQFLILYLPETSVRMTYPSHPSKTRNSRVAHLCSVKPWSQTKVT